MKCKSCGLEKDPSLFYTSNKSECKECVKIRTKRNREEKLEYYQEYDRNRPNAEERHKKQNLVNKERLQADPEFKEKIYKNRSDWSKRNKVKRQAQAAISNGIRDGKVERKTTCEHCNTSEKKIEAHHWSYLPEHRLDVIWLCTSCHGKEHKRLNELGRDPDKQNELESVA